MNRKTSRLILIFLLFLLVLIYYFRKRGEERIIPGVEDASGKKALEQLVVEKSGASQSSPISSQTGNIPSPEKTPDPFADLEPSTPVLAMLYGKVTDKDGNPIPDAGISVRYSHSEMEVLASSFTDEQGRYRFANLPVISFRVLATKPGYYLEYENVTFSFRKLSIEQNFEMSQGGLSLAGIIQDKEGKSVSKAFVLLRLPESYLFLSRTSDDKGGFRFDGLSRESADLTVTAPGFAAFSESPVIIGKEDMRIILSSEGGTKIRGTVQYYDSREPAPGAAIIIEREIQRFEQPYSLFFTANVDEKGFYETVPLTPGIYKFRASSNSCDEGSDMTKEITLLEGAGEEMWMDLFLPGMHDIRGRVLDAENRQPVAGAMVKAYSIPPKTVQTDSQGRFRISDFRRLLSQNLINLTAQAPGYTLTFKTIRNISGKIPPVVLKLPKGACVFGTIYSSSGEPVSRADWEIQEVNWQVQLTGHNPPTDTQGRYEDIVTLDLLGKQVYIYAYSPKYGYGVDVFYLPEEIWEMRRDITLSPGVSVTVWVLDKDGAGIKDCEINARTWEKCGNALSCSLHTDVEGCAVFGNLPKSLFKFAANDHRNNISKTRTLDLTSIESPQEIVFSLDEPEEVLRVVYGRVTDEQDNPLKDVLVESYFVRKETLTDSEGQYHIEMTSRDEMSGSEIGFSKTGYTMHTRDFNSDQKEVRLDAIMKKQDSMVFFGTILGRCGDIPTEAEIDIWMKDENNALLPLDFKRVSLIQGGAFEFNFDPMYYKVGRTYFLKARDYVHGSGRSQDIKDVGNRSVGPFEIVLSWGMLKGYLRDGKTGNTVSHGLISTLEIDGGNYDCFETRTWGSGAYTMSDESGYFELSPLPPGSSLIYIYHPEYWIQKKTSPEMTLENLEMEWNPVLDACASLEGRIINNDGAPLRSVEISINSTAPSSNNSQYFSRSIETDEQGRYSFKGIPPGEHFLYHSTVETSFNYPCHMKRENIFLTGSEHRVIDIHIPKLVPAVFQTKNTIGISLEPLYPADYTKLDIYLSGSDPDHSYRVLLPPGRYRMRIQGNETTAKEIEIHPTGENRIKIEDEK